MVRTILIRFVRGLVCRVESNASANTANHQTITSAETAPAAILSFSFVV